MLCPVLSVLSIASYAVTLAGLLRVQVWLYWCHSPFAALSILSVVFCFVCMSEKSGSNAFQVLHVAVTFPKLLQQMDSMFGYVLTMSVSLAG